MAQLWLVEPSQAQGLYDTPVGLVTRSLITANFGQSCIVQISKSVLRSQHLTLLNR